MQVCICFFNGNMGPNSQTILGQSCEDNFRTDDNLITYILRQNLTITV